MTISLVIEGEASDLQVHTPGFLTEVRRGVNEVIPLTHHGRRSALMIASRVLLSQDDQLSLSDALQALPQEWSMSFNGVEAAVSTAASSVMAAMSMFESGLSLHCSNFDPPIESAITNSKGEFLVLLQQSGLNGIRNSTPNSKHFSAHVARKEYIGVVLGAIRHYCTSDDVQVSYNDPEQGYQITRWNFSRIEQVRAFLEELEPHLDDLEYCRKAGLLQFCKLDLSKIILKNKFILDF